MTKVWDIKVIDPPDGSKIIELTCPGCRATLIAFVDEEAGEKTKVCTRCHCRFSFKWELE